MNISAEICGSLLKLIAEFKKKFFWLAVKTPVKGDSVVEFLTHMSDLINALNSTDVCVSAEVIADAHGACKYASTWLNSLGKKPDHGITPIPSRFICPSFTEDNLAKMHCILYMISKATTVSVGSGNGSIELQISPGIVTVEPTPKVWQISTGRIEMPPMYSFLEDLLNDRPEVVGNMNLMLISPHADTQYDYDAVVTAQPHCLFLVWCSDGLAGSAELLTYINRGDNYRLLFAVNAGCHMLYGTVREYMILSIYVRVDMPIPVDAYVAAERFVRSTKAATSVIYNGVYLRQDGTYAALDADAYDQDELFPYGRLNIV